MENTPQTKICTKCKINKNLSEYYKDSTKSSGLAPSCKKCINLKSKKYRENNKDKIACYFANYSKEKREKISAYQKEWYSKNKEKIKYQYVKMDKYDKDRSRKYYENNIDRLKDNAKKYRKNNKESIKIKFKLYMKTESFKISSRLSTSKRRSLKKSTSDNTITKKSLVKLRNLQKDKCYHCGAGLDFNKKWSVHLDHFIPLSKGGTHSIDNVVWSCAKCNLEKKAKMPTTLMLI